MITVQWWYKLPTGAETKPIIANKDRFEFLTKKSANGLEIGERRSFPQGKSIGRLFVKRLN